MKRLLPIALLTLACAIAHAQYVIQDYHVDMELRQDGSMGVIERINVKFTIPRRGIFRVIPVDYPTGKGMTRRAIIDVIDVRDSADRVQTTKIERIGPNLSIRIGDESVVYPSGTIKTYIIRYEAVGMMNWFTDEIDWDPYAELYWNVIGNEWDTSIEKASFRVTFPEVPSANHVRMRAFGGAYGDRSSITVRGFGSVAAAPPLFTSLKLTQSTAEGARLEPLPAYNGLTIVINMPADLIQRPTGWLWFKLVILPNIGFLIPVFVLVAMFLLWAIYGRDPHGGPVVVQYDPPDGMTASEAGAMIDENVDQRDVSAGIISLAVKGCLDVEFGAEEGLIFKRRPVILRTKDKPDDVKLTPFEQRLLSRIKKGGSTVTEDDLKKHVATDMATLHSKLYESLVKRGYYRKSPSAVRGGWAFGGVIVVIAIAFIVANISPFINTFPSILGAVLGCALVIAFSKVMPRRTMQGAKIVKQVHGFEEFIRRAERKELEWQSKVDPSAALFERFLPYAMAFDLTREWTNAFSSILTEPPSWYHHPGGISSFNSTTFSHDLDFVGKSLATSAGTPPRSSGGSGGSSGFSSGGGFSGGGFGGGGGSSW